MSHEVKVDDKKIATIVSWPEPKNISELRGFLGLIGYYRKFVQGYKILARLLTNLLKNGQFGWNLEVEKAFINLKKAMTSTPTLAMPDFNDTFVIETDASSDGIGAILQQQGQSIAFMIRALGITKKSLSTYAKEMFAIVEAIRLSGQRERASAMYRAYAVTRCVYLNNKSIVEIRHVHHVDQALLSRDELLRQLKKNLETETNRMKQITDRKRRDVEFQERDMVYLKLQHYRQSTVFCRAHQKLASSLNEVASLWNKVLYVGNVCHKRMQHGKILSYLHNNFLNWPLRTKMIDFSRVQKELQECSKDIEASGIKVTPVSDNLVHLTGIIPGPVGTPYEGGTFRLDITLPDGYPFEPPKMHFVTKVCQSGAICLDILKDQWSPALTLKTALLSVQALLSAPAPDDPQDAVVAQQYLKDHQTFLSTARYWTESFAKTSSLGVEEKVQKLVEMGFPESQVRSTLEIVGGDENMALEKLLSS
ncbi:ubiquitin-conjugating enzyme E2 27 [Citrus sinensis]|uniref:Ubiquitin-conjugating enzyme E2 27 n=1 Tax=Citrus sinensis TaxID=2711 RepID=A0ACB8L9M4_CITSI|nr:ubiquitin-conjugating enzyme E2 27 [Citrus sinensis]